MKKYLLLFALALFISAGSLFAQSITFSGILDSSVSMRKGEGNSFFFGIEEYANLRMQAKLREKASVFAAVNLIAAAGDSAVMGITTGLLSAGENYAAAIELERLYFRLNGEIFDFDGGLLRLPFGYGQVWGSSDFLNPRNPLIPDARPRAVLGAGLSWYPKDEIKLLFFGTAPREPFSLGDKGWLAGLSMDSHWEKASLQTLYSFETPKTFSNKGIHRAGVSLKADIEIGFVIDALYNYNSEADTKIEGLSFSAGADYSFFEGDLIILIEYLYNGETSSTAFGYGGYFLDRHYLYTGFTWRFNDYTNANAAFISGFDKFSFTPALTLNHDLFQGAVLIFMAQMPITRDEVSDDLVYGFLSSLKLRLRF